MFKYYRYLFPGLIALVLGFRLAAIVLVRPAPVIDEALHLNAVEQFGPGLPTLTQLRDYPSATGPFFYVLFGNLGALFKYDLTLLRIAVFAISLGSLVLFHRILKRLLPGENPMPAVALLATAPYFPALAGVFMTEHLALFLGLASLLCYLRFHGTGSKVGLATVVTESTEKEKMRMKSGSDSENLCGLCGSISGSGSPTDLVLALLFATLAIYTRIYMAFLPAAFCVTDIVGKRTPYTVNRTPQDHRNSSLIAHRSSSDDRSSSLITHHSSLIVSAIWLLPIVAFVPLALLWRGLAPPSFQHIHHAGLNWQSAGWMFIWTGIFFLPWVWRGLKPWHLVALLAVPLVLASPLPGLGFTRTALKLLPQPLAVAVACLAGIVGLLWFIRLAPLTLEPGMQVAAIGTFVLAAGLFVSGQFVYERYLLPGIPLMLICARPARRQGLALAWAVLFQLPIAVAHILHLAG